MIEIYDKVVSVRFTPVSKAYYFDANGYDLHIDDYVIVESIRGKQIGQVVKVMDEYTNEGDSLKPVIRPASSKDLVAKELFNQKKDEALEFARKRLDELNLKGVKILDAEFSYDGSRLQINYSSDNDEKVDLKTLKYDLLRNFPTVNAVDLRQLGPRDVAKMIPGMGACGLSCRCCCRYLTEFSSISIKMAKEQGISLTPTEITGMCGRLRCCLVFENDYYVECRKKLPKKNKRVMTPQGEGKVIEVFPLRDAVLVEIPEVGRREYKRDQIGTEDQNTVPQPDGSTADESEKEFNDDDILALVSGSEVNEKPEKTERPEKAERPEKPARAGKNDRKDRPERPERDGGRDKAERKDRRDRSARAPRQDRRNYPPAGRNVPQAEE